MSKVKTLHIINHNRLLDIKDDTLYITLTKIMHKKLLAKSVPSKYLFEDDGQCDLKKDIDNISDCLHLESEKYHQKRWFTITFKFIYKYLLHYNYFYDIIKSEIEKHSNLKYINISERSSKICQIVSEELCNVFDLEINYIDEDYIGLSDCVDNLATDLPEPSHIDSHNIFIYLVGKYLKYKKHNTFILPSNINLNIPKNVNIFKKSYLSVIHRLISKLINRKNINFKNNISSIDFKGMCDVQYKIDDDIWSEFRDDQKKYIENIINIVLHKYPSDYIDIIKSKIKLLFTTSDTQKIIVDDTMEVMKRVMMSAAQDLNIEIDFLPHGIVCEDEHINTLNTLYKNTKVLAWNNDSKIYFNKNNLTVKSIHYPINISKTKKTEKKDVLMLMSGGKYIVNSFENIMTNFLENKYMFNLDIDWKYHQLLNKNQIDTMNNQYKSIKRYYKRDITLINSDIRLTDIMSNYKILGFTTWTTGIFEAALSDIPFFIYTKEPHNINAFNSIDMPIAYTIDECMDLIERKDRGYLNDIKKSLTDGSVIF